MENIIAYLVPLIFILAYVVPKFKKSEQAKSEPIPVEAKKQQPGVFSKLNKMVEEYYQSDQEVSMQKQEVASQDWYDEPYEDEDEEPERKSDNLNREVPKIEPQQRPEPVISQVKESAKIVHQSPVSGNAQADYIPLNVSAKDLRKAIVWSEILGPPKALRNE